jgi:hypothetical protein
MFLTSIFDDEARQTQRNHTSQCAATSMMNNPNRRSMKQSKCPIEHNKHIDYFLCFHDFSIRFGVEQQCGICSNF